MSPPQAAHDPAPSPRHQPAAGLALNDNATLLALPIEAGFTLAGRGFFPKTWRQTA